jgi:hypothetical protein
LFKEILDARHGNLGDNARMVSLGRLIVCAILAAIGGLLADRVAVGIIRSIPNVVDPPGSWALSVINIGIGALSGTCFAIRAQRRSMMILLPGSLIVGVLAVFLLFGCCIPISVVRE